jgi:hypothetical protein
MKTSERSATSERTLNMIIGSIIFVVSSHQ